LTLKVGGPPLGWAEIGVISAVDRIRMGRIRENFTRIDNLQANGVKNEDCPRFERFR
jgi:hypothetical protein